MDDLLICRFIDGDGNEEYREFDFREFSTRSISQNKLNSTYTNNPRLVCKNTNPRELFNDVDGTALCLSRYGRNFMIVDAFEGFVIHNIDKINSVLSNEEYTTIFNDAVDLQGINRYADNYIVKQNIISSPDPKYNIYPIDDSNATFYKLDGMHSDDNVSVVIPDTATSIFADTFCYSKINNLSGGRNIKCIGSHAFRSCDNTPDLEIFPNLEIIGVMAYAHSDLKRAYIGPNVYNIGDKAFLYTEIEEIEFSEGCEVEVGETTFLGCVNLKKVIIHGNRKIRYIGDTKYIQDVEIEYK